MSDMLDRYEASEAPAVVSARQQSDGKYQNILGISDRDNSVYQDNFTTREKGDTVVSLSNVDNDTKGNFTDEALEQYDEEITKLVDDQHKYNSSNPNSHYVNNSSVSSAPGTICHSGHSE